MGVVSDDRFVRQHWRVTHARTHGRVHACTHERAAAIESLASQSFNPLKAVSYGNREYIDGETIAYARFRSAGRAMAGFFYIYNY